MQFVRTTADQYGIDPFNPEQSIRAAGQYLSNALKNTNGDVRQAFQSYNMGLQGARRFAAGEKNVAGDPKYADKVLTTLAQFSPGASKFSPPQAPAKVTPKTDAEAAEFGMFGTPMAAVDRVNVSPKQASWENETTPLAMTLKLNAMFASLSAEHEQSARSGRARLEALLDQEDDFA
jgi:hypothetical protein